MEPHETVCLHCDKRPEECANQRYQGAEHGDGACDDICNKDDAPGAAEPRNPMGPSI